MNENEETYWQIQDYLQGKFSGKVLSDFEARISSDLDLKEQIDFHKLADNLILENKMSTVSSISLQSIQNIKKNILIKKIILVSAISITSFSLANTYLYHQKQVMPSESLYEVKPKIQKEIKTKERKLEESEKELTVIKENIDPKSTKISSQQEQNKTLSSQDFIQVISTADSLESIPKKIQSVIESQETKIKVSDIPCSNVTVEAVISVKNTCKNESNGQIYVAGFSGGSKPYTFKITYEDHSETASDQLQAGLYSVLIQDKNHCEREYIGISVKEIACSLEEKSFNPSLGETLDLGSQNQEVSLTIYSKSGNMHFSKTFSADETILWNGLSQKGILETGYFIYYLNFKDGTSTHGEVTVTQ